MQAQTAAVGVALDIGLLMVATSKLILEIPAAPRDHFF